MKYSRSLLDDLDLTNISEVARTLNITRNTARSWINKYNQNEPTPPTNTELMEILQDVQSMLTQLLLNTTTTTTATPTTAQDVQSVLTQLTDTPTKVNTELSDIELVTKLDNTYSRKQISQLLNLTDAKASIVGKWKNGNRKLNNKHRIKILEVLK